MDGWMEDGWMDGRWITCAGGLKMAAVQAGPVNVVFSDEGAWVLGGFVVLHVTQ